MRNREITQPGDLLHNGKLTAPGWSRREYLRYRRADVKASAFRIKEWDYYLVLGGDFGVAMTISDDGYIGLQSVSLLDFARGVEHTETILNPFPMGKLSLPESSDGGVTEYSDKRLQMRFEAKPGKRLLSCRFQNFWKGKPFQCDIELDQPEMDSMVIATPWAGKNAFYYNRKINCMRASGSAVFDGREYLFDPSVNYGTLDWVRGVWTYDNTWYWGSGNGIVEGKPFGFNLGYGFGDTTAASENVIFFDGVASKLDDVDFGMPAEGYMDQWHITSDDGRFEARFTPVLDRVAKINALLIVTDQHQVFGRLTGHAVLDGGCKIEFSDILCFFEKVQNKY